MLYTLLSGICLLCGAHVANANEVSGTAEVIDGDSLVVAGEEIRLAGIDAPEGRQTCHVNGYPWRCGEAAAETLSFLVSGKSIRCEFDHRDPYERALATCYRGDTNINRTLVASGMALVYRGRKSDYEDDERRAKSLRRGIWDSEFVAPWKWRLTQRRAAETITNDCPIKGNVNRKGEKIYHPREGRDYKKVRINAEQGDRCFDSAAAASAAGFRAARH